MVYYSRKIQRTGGRTVGKKGKIIGCILWLAGLVLTIVGLNLSGETGTWMTVVGNIGFLAGLALVGVAWFQDRKRNDTE